MKSIQITAVTTILLIVVFFPVFAQVPGPGAPEGMGSPLRYGSETGPMTGGYNSHADAADFDGDGDLDLVVHSSLGGGAKNNFWGIHIYERISSSLSEKTLLFAAPQKVLSIDKPVLAYDWDRDGFSDLIVNGKWHRNQGGFRFDDGITIPNLPLGVTRIVDWNGDDIPDLLSGDTLPGDFWPLPSVWKNGEPPYTPEGIWKGGALRNTLRFYQGKRINGCLSWEDCGILQAGGYPLEIYGGASPALADWDGDSDLDLLVGGHYNLTYFENTGTPSAPKLAGYRRVKCSQNYSMRGIYIRPMAYPLKDDSYPGLMIAQESGEITFLECLDLTRDKTPRFGAEQFPKQRDPFLDAGCLSTISVADWDKDGDPDIVSGNSYGEVVLFLNEKESGRWERKKIRSIHIQAGPNGSIQGPNEAHYGYTCPVLFDLNRDGQMDIVLSDVWGKYSYYERDGDSLKKGVPICCRFYKDVDSITPRWIWFKPPENPLLRNMPLITQWRCQPAIVQWDDQECFDFITLDSQGFLALYPGTAWNPYPTAGKPERAFLLSDGKPIRITNGLNGRAGRARIVVADWDGDGDRDIIRGCTHAGDHEDPRFAEYERVAVWYENSGDDRSFEFRGSVMKNDEDVSFCGHATSPAVVDWDGNGSLDLLLGTEDGLIYFFQREYLDGTKP